MQRRDNFTVATIDVHGRWSEESVGGRLSQSYVELKRRRLSRLNSGRVTVAMVDHSNTVYYFFSTSAQCFAAVTAVVGTLSVFKYQSLLNALAVESERLTKYFDSRITSWASPVEDKAYKRQLTASQKVAFARELFLSSQSSPEDAIRRAAESFAVSHPTKVPEQNAKDCVGARQAFIVRHPEFWNDWSSLVDEAKRLKHAVYRLTAIGLLLLVVAIAGTITPSVFPLRLQVVAIAGMLVSTTWFALESIRVVSTCFEEPWKTKKFD